MERQRDWIRLGSKSGSGERANSESVQSPEQKRLAELDRVFSLNKYVFFLGGMDAEMYGIQRILEKEGVKYESKHLSWGAKAEDYEEGIEQCRREGYVPVLVELEGADAVPNAVAVDHHGIHAGREASIMQVMFEILYRKEILLGINDAEYIGGLLKKGATEEEIRTIREIDRISQGITEEEEAEAARAIQTMERFPELNDLIVVHMRHSKTATVADRLFMNQFAGKGQNLLIISAEKGETNYLSNTPDLCKLLQQRFGGWIGGKGLEDSSSNNVYWGVNKDVKPDIPPQIQVIEFVKNYFRLHEPQ